MCLMCFDLTKLHTKLGQEELPNGIVARMLIWDTDEIHAAPEET